MNKFWFVWNPQRNTPSHQHPSKTSANKEAQRLAELNPGEKFVVLEALGHYCTRKPTEWTKYEKAVEFENNGSGWHAPDVPF